MWALPPWKRWGRWALTALIALAIFGGQLRTSFGAIAEGVRGGNMGVGVSTLSWLHTVAAGNNRLLLVRVGTIDRAVDVNSVTFGGTSMSPLANVISNGTPTSQVRASIWYLLAPAVGTATVQVNLSGSTQVAAGSQSYTGVAQTSTFGAVSTNSGSNASASSVTVAAGNNDLVVDLLAMQGVAAASLASGTGQSATSSTGSTGSTGSDIAGGASSKSVNSSTTMSWTTSTNSQYAHIGVALKPALLTISGTVFEDANYGGGAGRSLAASGGTGIGIGGVTVELYTSAGAYISSTTSAADGSYSFSGLAFSTSYHVRVPNTSVLSKRTGTTASLRGVMTYRTNAASGSAVAVTDFVGGTNPALVDPGAANSGAAFNTSTLVYNAGLSGTAQSVTLVALGTNDIASVDFGFNFDTVVNTNDTGQGSLRQAITNANTLSGDTALAVAGRTAGVEHLNFMLSNGGTSAGGAIAATGGLRSSINYFSGTPATATITVTSGEIAITSPLTLPAASTATRVSGNTNSRIFSTTSAVDISDLTLMAGAASSGNGGCITATGGSLTLTGAVLSACKANNGEGGAIAATGTAITMTSVQVLNASAQSGNGGAVLLTNGSLSVATSTFNGNTANNGGGGIWLAGSASGVITDTTFSTNTVGGVGGGAVAMTSSGSLSITRATFNGNTANNGGGGGVWLAGSASGVITDTTFNTNTVGSGAGGGAVGMTSSGSLSITRATFNGNTANNGGGGGLYVASGTATATNATFYANSANNGGAAAAGGGSLALVNATVASNSSLNGAGGLMRSGGTLSARNTIVSANTGSAGNCNGTITSLSNNLDSASNCGFGTANGSLSNSNPTLSALASNGGSTQTLALGASSPAINAGTSTGAPATDQRGYSRTGQTDIGAFEYAGSVPGSYTVSGTVFEDASYGGGAGRSLVASSGSGASGATVELYNSAGTYVTSTTATSGGGYSFTGLASGNYYVRVVSATVLSQRTGSTSGLLGVMTYRSTAASGTAVAVTDFVGGTNPALADPGTASSGAAFNTSTLIYSAGLSGTAQNVTPVTLGSASISGLDFGFNFDTVVNTNDAGQGSLRQAITNANTLGGDASLAVNGRTAAVEHIVFMIPNGTTGAGGSLGLAAGGLRSSLTAFSSGVATIAPTTALTTISNTLVIDARAQPGWTSTPIVELNGTGAGASVNGLNLTASSSTLAGLVINRFTGAGIAIGVGITNTVAANYVGTNSAGTAASANAGGGITVSSASNTIGGNTSASRNVIAGNTGAGISIGSGGNSTTVRANTIGLNAAGTAAIANTGDGISVTKTTGAIIGGATAGMGNVIGGNGGNAITLSSSSGHSVLGNTLGVQGDGSTALASTGGGIVISATATSSIGGVAAGSGNTIRLATAKGVVVTGSTSSGNSIRGNAIYGSTGIGIDLGGDGLTANDGAKTASQPNLLMDQPVFSAASLSGTTLSVAGYVGSAASQSTFAAATVDVYSSDNVNTNGSGQTYLGTLTADASGNFSGTLDVTGKGVVNGSTRLTGTATDAPGNTSEFGANLTVTDRYTVINTQDGATTLVGSLRWALTNAIADAGVQTVRFSIPSTDPNLASGVWTITPTSALPVVTDATLIDASTQPGYVGVPLVQIRGTSAGASSNGLQFTTAAGSTARGLVISGFGGCAVRLDGPGGHTVAGNYIGTAISGTAAASGNGALGVCVNSANNSVGGTGAYDRNVIGGFVLVSGTQGRGIDITEGANSNSVAGNYVGLGADGITAVANQNGIILGGASNNALGGITTAHRNVISGNQAIGVSLRVSVGSASGNTVAGNYIGTNAAGTAGTANGSHGVSLAGGSSGLANTTIGGSVAGAGNLIGGNSGSGVLQSGVGVTGTVISGNTIGLNAAGASALANVQGGVVIAFGGGASIGGTSSLQRNVISGNTGSGVLLSTDGNTVQGNYIGTNPAGNSAIGNTVTGVQVSGANNVVGGQAAGAGNVISGNTGVGLLINGSLLSNTQAVVEGNIIGRNASKKANLANGSDGVRVATASLDMTTIGGTAAAAANTIAGNARHGVQITGSGASASILGNSIFGNGNLGIDLVGTSEPANSVTANDGVKTTGQPNLLMDSPVFTSARARGNQLTVAGYVGSAAGQSVFANARVEVFVSDNDSSGFGEGQTYLGFVTTDASGNFSGTLTMAGNVLAMGTRLTGTATDASSNTSEFGANFANLVVDMVVNDNGDAVDANPGDGLCATAGGVCTLRAALAEINASAAQSSTPTVAFALPGCSAAGQAACSIAPASALPAFLRSMVIDAQTQAGWTLNPMLELNGVGAGAGSHGFTLNAAASGVRGFTVNRFSGVGIYVNAAGSGGVLAGNWVGLNAAGTTASGNTGGGVYVGAAGVTVGGSTAATRNVVSANGSAGGYTYNIRVAAVANTVITGNYVGTNALGSASPGNGWDNIQLTSSASNTQIGGTTAGLGNVVAGAPAGASGIAVFAGSTGTTIQGNIIGLDATASVAIPNGNGVWFQSGTTAAASTVGGTAAGAGNTIARNAMVGVAVIGTTKGVSILGNRIYGNTSQGIDLAASNIYGDGVTVNTGSTSASLPNNGMNYPVLTAASVNSTATALTVSGYIGVGTGQALFAGARVELFKAAPDLSGFGEGQVYLGALTADANGRFSGSLSFTANLVAVGDAITGTATDTAGNSSEFGPNWVSTSLAALLPSKFNVFESSTVAGALSGVIKTKTVGVPSVLDVIAIDTGGLAVSTVFSGSVTLTWIDARDNSGAVSADGCRSSWVASAPAGSASYTGGLARQSVTLTPAAVGRDWRLRITYTPATGSAVVSCSGDNFAIKPSSLLFTAVGDSTDSTAASGTPTRSLMSATASQTSGGAVHRAGQPFSLRASAVNASNGVQTGYDGSPALLLTGCALPSSGCVAGTLAMGSVSVSSGSISSDTLTYSEVGSVTMQLRDTTFANVDLADSSAAERLVESAAVTVGRFVPDRYVLAATNVPQFATQQSSCAATGQGYTYVGQNFGWAAAPTFSITAQNAAGATTALWSGALQKINTSAHLARALAASTAQGLVPVVTWGSMALTDAGGGVANVSLSGDQFLFSRNAAAPVASFNPAITLSVALSDASEAGVSGNTAVTALSNLLMGSVTGIAFNQGSNFQYGRLKLQGAFGDVRRGVQANIELQKFSTRGWVRLSEDNTCTSLPASAVAFGFGAGAFAADACATPASAPVVMRMGRGTLALPKTAGNVQGATTVFLNLGASLEGSACLAGTPVSPLSAALPHLLGARGLGTSQDQNPAARLTWGRQHRDYLTLRELY